MHRGGLFRRRHLPHIDVEDKPYFITACLHGSLSAAGLTKIRGKRTELDERPVPPGMPQATWERQKHKLLFKFIDQLLDHHSPVRFLADERCARIVHDAFFHFADERYRLFAFAIMPSHHHWLFLPEETWVQADFVAKEQMRRDRTPREVISHSIQSFTATRCNRVLNRSGAFWQNETFDHFCRDEAEMIRIVHYIEQNPVIAGLAQQAGEYRWSSAYYRERLALPPDKPIPKEALLQVG